MAGLAERVTILGLRAHQWLYERTDGRVGQNIGKLPTLLLRTKGARTGQTRVAALIAQGKTQEEVIAAKPLADLDARVQQIGTTGDRFLGQVYAELKAGK